ncbi:MAG: hypothetical protein AAGA48_01205 [Myxococcota bacterium]
MLLLFAVACAPDDASPTYYQDVAPLLAERCEGCHRSGGIGTFPFESYDAVAPLAPLIAESTASGQMPPWPAVESETCTPPHGWVDDLRLTDHAIDLLTAWDAAGAPAGEVAEVVVPPDLTALPEPSLTLTPSTSVTIEGTEDQYLCRSLDPGLDAPVWITGLQVQPGDPAVVHHALVFADPTGASASRGDDVWPCFGGSGVPNTSLLQPWAPGQLPYELPPDTGFPLPAGGRFVVSTHYHPVPGEVHEDASSLEIRFSPTPPARRALVTLIGNGRGLQPGPSDRGAPEFRIPSGAKNHVETMVFDNPADALTFKVFSVGGHLHWVGTSIEVRIERADGDTCLLNIPDWDFDWQMLYRYDAPFDALPEIRPGDRLVVRCTYDNTLDNPEVATLLAEEGLTEPIDVELGEATTDEMCLTMLGLAPVL